MQPYPVGGPPVEPVGLAEMRAYLRLDHELEDPLVRRLITAARLQVEAATGRCVAGGLYRLILDRWPPARLVRLPLRPLVGIERVAVADGQGAFQDLAPGLVLAHPTADPPALTVLPAAPDPRIPLGGILIEVRAGDGEGAPEALRQAVRMLAARWFEHRGDGAGEPMPPDAAALVAPYRRFRI
jgi:uncharacterized phiE125 gp8 family phage protein